MTQQLTIEQLKFARSIGATHYDWEHEYFRKSGYFWMKRKKGWGVGVSGNDYHRFPNIQLIDFSPLDELEPEYVPEVGEECEFNHPEFGWTGCTIIGPFRNRVVCAPNGGGFYDADVSSYRPLPDPEQQRRDELLEKWQRRSLDNAHDTEASVLTVGEMIDFIVELESE